MPAFAITKPSLCCMIIRFGRLRTTLVDSDSTTSTTRGSLPTSAASLTASAEGMTSARSTVRPSALETIFCAITTTSRSRRTWPARPSPAMIKAGKSSPTRTIGRPGSANSSSRDVMSPEAGAQLRQHHVPVELEEAGLVVAGGMKHQMTEAHINVWLDLLDMLVGIGRNDPAAGGTLDRQGVGEPFHFLGVVHRHLFFRGQSQGRPDPGVFHGPLLIS